MEIGHDVGMHQQSNSRNRDLGLVASIEQMLRELLPVTKECSIYRVPKRLLNINPLAHTPQVISIGPFHRGREDLMPMEQHKLRFLNGYLRRMNMSVEDAVGIARSWERQARSCYAEPINMTSDDFVKMMLLDAYFIVEFMLMVCGDFPPTQIGLDPSFYEAISIDLYRDLTMLENQLPFFILQRLFLLFSSVSFVEVTHRFFNIQLIKSCELPRNISTRNVNHSVDFLSIYYAPTLISTTSGSNGCHEEQVQLQLQLPPTATELCEAGVVFKKAAEDKCIMDISFKDGVLEIPSFEIHDVFETCLRNLMAFEQYPVGNHQRYAIHYVAFLDGLISSEKDVNLLVNAKIITNHIGGSDEEISKLFNSVCKDIIVKGDYYYFQDMGKILYEHCRARRHRWMASLRRDYFNSPWASISFFAAFLILLTFLQTLFSAISLFHS